MQTEYDVYAKGCVGSAQSEYDIYMYVHSSGARVELHTDMRSYLEGAHIFMCKGRVQIENDMNISEFSSMVQVKYNSSL